MFLRAASVALAGLLLAAPVSRAQAPATARVGVCNLGKVWEQMEERKVLNDQNVAERDKLKAEAARRQAEVKDIQDQRNGLKPGSAQYEEKTKLLMEKAIELDVWLRMKDAELGRKEKEQTKMLFDKVADGCKDVAERDKLDLVLCERRPELPANMDQLKPDDVKAILAQRDVLYINKTADITDSVVVVVNKKYNAGATPAPAAGSATPTPPASGK